MCHSIFWYHALCLHLDASASSMIFCSEAIVCGDECLPAAQEHFYIPLMGKCCVCQEERARCQKGKRRRELVFGPGDADEDWSWMYPVLPAQKSKRRRHHHHHHHHHHHQSQHDPRVEGSEDEDGTINQQQHQPRKCSNMEEWNHASDTLTPDASPSTPKDESQSESWTSPSKITDSGKTQRSSIPVPQRQTRTAIETTMTFELNGKRDDDTQCESQTCKCSRYQRSGIPVRKNRFQRDELELDARTPETTLSAEMSVESGVDEMELFDRVTF